MALTKEQAVIAGLAWVALAGDAAAAEAAQDAAQAAAPHGETIAQQAAAVKTGGVPGQHGAPKKVASAKGSAFYHAPIGTLIIPHGHFVQGAPSHWVSGNISEAKWVANQWPDKDKAAQAAHAAVQAGTHRLVQVGQHSYAVHKGLQVHVPKSTDLHDPVAVKNAPKTFVKPGTGQEHVNIHPGYAGEPVHTDALSQAVLGQDWKPLPHGEDKKPVSFHGKQAAWVPDTWKVYKMAPGSGAPETHKWAKDPAGAWHAISIGGSTGPGAAPAQQYDDWVRQGLIVPDDDAPAEHAVSPLPDQAGPQKPAADIGGVAATKDEIHKAIQVLSQDKSTAVKQPLAKAGHPLAAMDYHGLAAAELAKHPELKVSKGSKKAHVGQVKLAVLHHLAGRAQHLAHTEAEAEVAKAAQDKAQDAAEHAYVLTPHAYEIGGVQAAKDEIQDAIAALQASKSTAIKQTLAHAGNPLAASDYHQVVKDYQAAHPDLVKAKGTKQQHAGNAKAWFIAALQEKAGLAAKADQDTGHDAAAALYQQVLHGTVKPGWTVSVAGAVAQAAKWAVQHNHGYYVRQAGNGAWTAQTSLSPGHDSYIKVTPELQLTEYDSFIPDGIVNQPLLKAAVDLWLAQGKQPEHQPPSALPEITSAGPLISSLVKKPDPAAGAKAWKNTKQWPEIHQKVQQAVQDPGIVYSTAESQDDVVHHLARMLYVTAAAGTTRWLAKAAAGKSWKLFMAKPEEGSFAASAGQAFYEVTPDHQITLHYADGGTQPYSTITVLYVAKHGFKKPAAPPPVTPPEKHGTVPVWAAGKKVGEAPEGSTFWTGSGVKIPLDEAVKFVQYPDGSWHMFGGFGQAGAAVPKPSDLIPVPPEAVQGKVKAEDFNGKAAWYAPGSGVWKKVNGKAYVREPDGTWFFAHAGTKSNGATLEEWVSAGKLVPQNKAAKDYAAAAEAKKHTSLPGTKPEQPALDVVVYGKHYPAGTKVYGPAAFNVYVKYVKEPGGQWWYQFQDGHSAPGEAVWDKVVAGDPVKFPEETGGAPAGEKKPAEENKPGIPAIYQGKIVGEYPAGSKLYRKVVGSYQGVYAYAPDGKWYTAGSYSVHPAASYQISGKPEDLGHALEPEPLPTAEDIQQAEDVKALKELLTRSTVDPGKSTWKGGKQSWPTWQQAALAALAKKVSTSSDVAVHHTPDGFSTGYGESADWRKISGTDLSVLHFHGDGPTEEVPFAQLKEAAARYLIPDSVLIAPGAHGSLPSLKVFRFGFWKNPKGKSYLQISAGTSGDPWKDGPVAKAVYTYYGADGNSKEVTPAYAAKVLEKATEWSAGKPSAQAKASSAPKAAYAAVYEQPGQYHLLKNDALGGAINVKGDGSAVLAEQGYSDVAFSGDALAAMLRAGSLVDQFATTVVTPGIQPTHYRVFGSAEKTREDLQQLKKDMEQGWDGGWQAPVLKFLTGSPEKAVAGSTFQGKQFLSFAGSKGISGGDGQRAAVYGLLTELLNVPELPEGTKLGTGTGEEPGVKEPQFLKGMPAGISSSKDIFTWTEAGAALPFTGELTKEYPGLSKADTLAKIKAISAQFGDGKVVGTHLSAFSTGQLHQWLGHWRGGDMAAVFKLDALGGKVSPAHPGALGNKDTHHITWSPHDPHQVPASKTIEGDWTDVTYEIPPAEVDNYLIKVGFQHAEYLTSQQKKMAVIAHREHDQDTVDHFTRLAGKAFSEGAAPVTYPLKRTDGLKPAKPYDQYVKESKPAADWTSTAVLAFAKDHAGELAPYAEQVAQEFGYSASDVLISAYTARAAVQKWLDDAHAKHVAEQSVPVWTKVPTGSLPSHGHPVYKALRTIPYTGEQTTWFVKPPPASSSGGTGAFRLEQEHAANLIGRALGYQSAESQLLTDPAFGDQPVQAQRAIPGEPLGYYTDLPPWSGFTVQQVADIAAEHMLDWVLFNDDTSANNMIKRSDGRIVGIDKGRSFGNLSWDGISGTHSADSMTQLAYTKLYDAIRGHELPKDTADQAYTQLIIKARKIAKVPDSRIRALLEEGLASRPGKWGSFGSRQGLIDEVIRRKNSLETDFRKLWAKVYHDAGFGDEPSPHAGGGPWGPAKANPRYGTVVFDKSGNVLLREVKNHFGGAAWTFSKGGADPGETPLQAAIRETAEETKYKFAPVGYVPGAFTGTTSTAYYYLARKDGARFTPELDNGETEQVRWVPPDEARQLIGQSESATVVQRDLAVLDAAHAAWQALPADVEPLPDGLGSALPDVPVQALPDGLGGSTLYSGFSEPGYTGHVAALHSHGVPAFFGGRELRDMHVLTWQQQDTAGDTVTHGETYLKDIALGKVVQWLKTHQSSALPAQDSETKAHYGADSYGPNYAPPGSPDRGVYAGEKEFYNTIIKAARTVTQHKGDGQYNQAKLAAMDDLAHKLELLSQIQVSPQAEQQKQDILSMTGHYLGLIAKVRKAREAGMGFGEGDLPRWVPPSAAAPDKPETDTLFKVQYGTTARHDKGSIDEETGRFVADKYAGTHDDPGHWWTVTLPEGETIQVGDGTDYGVELSHHGRLRFTTRHGDAASLERIREALQVMGLEMREAQERDFETFYWRHLYAIINDRVDAKTNPVIPALKNEFGKLGLAWFDKRQANIAALEQLGETDPDAETAAYRAAFAVLTSHAQVQDWAERGGFLPHLKHVDIHAPDRTGGKPDWYRFDLTPDKIAGLPMPIRQSSNPTAVAENTVKAGGTYSRDALMRVAGTGANGMSNPYDTGGPQYVFTRLNITSGRIMSFSPLTLARTKNYSYNEDHYGKWSMRWLSTHWDPGKWSKYSESTNETQISDALTLLDDIEVLRAASPPQRDELIAYLKNLGITVIRGLPVADRVVTSEGYSSALAKVRQHLKAHPEYLDPLREPGTWVQGTPEPPAVKVPAEPYTGATEPQAKAAEEGTAAKPEQALTETDQQAIQAFWEHTAVHLPVWKSEAVYYAGGPAEEEWFEWDADSKQVYGLKDEEFTIKLEQAVSTGLLVPVNPEASAVAASLHKIHSGSGPDPNLGKPVPVLWDIYQLKGSQAEYVQAPDGSWYTAVSGKLDSKKGSAVKVFLDEAKAAGTLVPAVLDNGKAVPVNPSSAEPPF